ncbi:MAG TPA: host nuclease inhibitor protein [Nitratidesulfovibrio sp.]|nr:host nuclease inhibitor protein [Nitratidesulfovibrio sp.]
MATEYVAYCMRSGRIRVGKRCPKNALPLFRGSAYRLRKLVCATSRHSYDGKRFLVPGVPEAASSNDAVDAVIDYQDWVLSGERAGVRRALGNN